MESGSTPRRELQSRKVRSTRTLAGAATALAWSALPLLLDEGDSDAPVLKMQRISAHAGARNVDEAPPPRTRTGGVLQPHCPLAVHTVLFRFLGTSDGSLPAHLAKAHHLSLEKRSNV